MPLFGQITRLEAAPGRADELVAKFSEAARIQDRNPACRLMFAGRSATEEDVVHLVEVWSSEEDWEQARTSEEIKVWAAEMPCLVAAPPESARFAPSGGKGAPGISY